jgi:hypothetical protein
VGKIRDLVNGSTNDFSFAKSVKNQFSLSNNYPTYIPAMEFARAVWVTKSPPKAVLIFPWGLVDEG